MGKENYHIGCFNSASSCGMKFLANVPLFYKLECVQFRGEQCCGNKRGNFFKFQPLMEQLIGQNLIDVLHLTR